MTEETEENQELRIRTTLRELVVYLIFLIILCIGNTLLHSHTSTCYMIQLFR